MSVTEILMRPGSGSLSMKADAPLTLTKAIEDLVTGVGCHVVITPTPIDSATVSDATLLSQALYTGRVIARPSRTSLEFTGLSSWLDSYNETAITRTAGTPTQWVGDVLVNNITSGTISGGSNVTASYPAHAQTRRQILDDVAKLGSWEYEVRPNFTINAGTSVFTTTPTVVITDKDEGPDGTFIGLLGGLVDQNIDASNVATKVVALGQGSGASIITGSATKTPALKTQNGSTPTLVAVVNAPNASTTNVGTVATVVNTAADVVTAVNVSSVIAPSGGTATSIMGAATVGAGATRGAVRASSAEGPTIFNRPGGNDAPGGGTVIKSPNNPEIVDPGGFADVPLQRAIDAATRVANAAAATAIAQIHTSISTGAPASESQFIRRVVRSGDNVYLYNLESGLFNTAQQITYRGEVIFPLTKRVLSMTWAIERGYGVYIRSNASTPVYYDLTPYVEWEAPGATLEVGDRPVDSFPGVVNRSNPDIESRVTTRARIAWSAVTITQGAAVAGTINRGFYVLRPDGTFTAHLTWTATAAGTAGNPLRVTLPTDITLFDLEDAGGSWTFVDTGNRVFAGSILPISTTTVALQQNDQTGNFGQTSAITIAVNDVLRCTIHGSYV